MTLEHFFTIVKHRPKTDNKDKEDKNNKAA